MSRLFDELTHVGVDGAIACAKGPSGRTKLDQNERDFPQRRAVVGQLDGIWCQASFFPVPAALILVKWS